MSVSFSYEGNKSHLMADTRRRFLPASASQGLCDASLSTAANGTSETLWQANVSETSEGNQTGLYGARHKVFREHINQAGAHTSMEHVIELVQLRQL